MVGSTLFSMAAWMLKPVTSQTTGAELDAAATAQEKMKEDAIKKAKEDAAAQPAAQHASRNEVKLSSNNSAVKKRNQRARKKVRDAKSLQAATGPMMAVEGIAQQPAGNIEQETHYVGARGRKRKRKTLRSRAGAAGKTGKGGRRVFTSMEKTSILNKYDIMKARTAFGIAYARVAKELGRQQPSLFGVGAVGMTDGISGAAVRQVVLRRNKLEDNRGRPPAVPTYVVAMIVAAFTSVVSARSTLISAPLL